MFHHIRLMVNQDTLQLHHQLQSMFLWLKGTNTQRPQTVPNQVRRPTPPLTLEVQLSQADQPRNTIQVP